MITSKRVSLAGTQLDSVDNRIVIRNVDTGVPHETLQSVSRMGAGQRMTVQHWDSLDVRVTFGIDIPKTNLAERREVWEKVMSWAMQTGWLTVNYMTGRRMYVDKAILPSSGDLWAWADDFTITFRAYGIPFWQDDTATSVTGTSGNLIITVPGNVKTVMDISFTNTSGSSISDINFSTGGNIITLTGISLANNGTVTISHGNDGLLRIYKGSTSIYEKYTGADDLYVNPGSNLVTVDKTGSMTASCYGRYV